MNGLLVMERSVLAWRRTNFIIGGERSPVMERSVLGAFYSFGGERSADDRAIRAGEGALVRGVLRCRRAAVIIE
jgi:hypothetical protein